jgi:hypothetical protein
MTKVMTKPVKKAAKPEKAKKTVKKAAAGEPKRRGRPPGSKNKSKTAAKPVRKGK